MFYDIFQTKESFHAPATRTMAYCAENVAINNSYYSGSQEHVHLLILAKHVHFVLRCAMAMSIKWA